MHCPLGGIIKKHDLDVAVSTLSVLTAFLIEFFTFLERIWL